MVDALDELDRQLLETEHALQAIQAGRSRQLCLPRLLQFRWQVLEYMGVVWVTRVMQVFRGLSGACFAAKDAFYACHLL